ncbi:MAG: hypothetical protein ABJD24_00860 [Acidimicrobiales bacterium]
MSQQTMPPSRSRWFVPCLVSGWLVMGFGVTRALSDSRDAHPFALVVHVVAFDLAHDLLVVPLILVVGWGIGRALPAVARGPVRSACAVSAMFVVVAYPLVRRWGRRPTNSSALPLAYGRNLVLVLAMVWAVALAAIVIRVVHLRRAVVAGAPHP